MYGRILVPIDGSNASIQGLDEAIKLARQLSARIRLIHVLDVGAPLALGEMPVVRDSSNLTDPESNARRAAANAILTEGTSRAQRAGVDVDSVLVEASGSPAGKLIVENAADCRADLIVCGTHGRSGLRRVLMGSDAEYIVRHTPVPVLLVRAP